MIEPHLATIPESTQVPNISKIIDRVQTVFTDSLNVEVSSPDTDLLESGLLDSLALVSLLLHIEREFGVSVSIEDMDFEHWRSIKAISSFLVSTLSTSELS